MAIKKIKGIPKIKSIAKRITIRRSIARIPGIPSIGKKR